LTILEVVLLVLLAIAVLGLVFVAIQASRESAQRMLCENNLKQVGQSLRGFQENKGFLPASRIADRHATWAVQIAPFLPLKDEENPLKGWDLTLSFYAQPEQVRTAEVLLYYCPARRLPPQLSNSGDVPRDGRPSTDHFPGALGDYACAAGSDDPSRPWETARADGALILGEILKRKDDRILAWRGRTSLTSLPRGLDRTIVIGEKHVPLDGFGQGAEGDGSLYNGDYPANSGRIGGPGHPLAQSPDDAFDLNFGSYHPRVCQFLFADGHVEALTVSLSGELLGRLLSRLEE
jgi:prepilin-type processing-associated H-X9-DG protein